MLSKLMQLSDNQDVKLFRTLVSALNSPNEGSIYSYMVDEYAKQNGGNKIDRNAMKVGIFEVLFSSNENKGKTGVVRLFKKLFPSVAELFFILKQNDYTLLSCLLQSIESHIMLKIITKRISKEIPNAPIFTIHDSITTTEAYASRVKLIMEGELTSIIGLPPKLRTERWHPDELEWDKYQLPLMDIE